LTTVRRLACAAADAALLSPELAASIRRVKGAKMLGSRSRNWLTANEAIGTVRREYLNRTLFWTAADLETKLIDFQHYFNRHRAHTQYDRSEHGLQPRVIRRLDGRLPEPQTDGSASRMNFDPYKWQKHCRGLYQTPIAARFYQFAMHTTARLNSATVHRSVDDYFFSGSAR
jgi:hypothetical protein